MTKLGIQQSNTTYSGKDFVRLNKFKQILDFKECGNPVETLVLLGADFIKSNKS